MFAPPLSCLRCPLPRHSYGSYSVYIQKPCAAGFVMPVVVGTLTSIMKTITGPEYGIEEPTPPTLINLGIAEHNSHPYLDDIDYRKSTDYRKQVDRDNVIFIPSNAGVGEISQLVERAFAKPYARSNIECSGRTYVFEGFCGGLYHDTLVLYVVWGS
jgi:hypothetical protein